MKNICVFCGSSTGIKESFTRVVIRTANLIFENKMVLIYGGANVGLMKILSNHILENNGKVIGIMPRYLIEKEVAHTRLTKMHIVESMQERKVLMAKLSDAFIALPGGFGTLDELTEMITYNQMRIHDKPLGILNTENYFDHLIKFFDHGVKEKLIRAEHRNNLIIEKDIYKLFEKLKKYKPVEIEKWIRDIRSENSNH